MEGGFYFRAFVLCCCDGKVTTVSKAMFQCSSSHLLPYSSSMKSTPCVLLLSISRGSLLCGVYIKMVVVGGGGFVGSPGPVARQLRLPNRRTKKRGSKKHSCFLWTRLPPQRRARPTSKCQLSEELRGVRRVVIFLLCGGRTA